ncbi:hypothetical protein SAY86_030213 [Trapa natans]|uniref:Uncharacterized protein n=1 Tax=Trapa natans TaxID=22666 RepID=A0AAN7MFQ0_TRANT|nr:hypothetical protein SAY86_030213 [Trapa natans]
MTTHSNNGCRNIKNDDKVFTRQLTRDSAAANSSSRVFYYAGSGAGSVPFMWESRPGTPKHPSSSSSTVIPPLTPPPSYQMTSSRPATPDRGTAGGQRTKPKVVAAILSKLSLSSSSRRTLHHMSPASSVSSSASSSSSTWTLSSPSRLSRGVPRKDLSWPEVPEDGRNHEEGDEEDDYSTTQSPNSTLRFSTGWRSTSSRGSRFQGCYPVKSVRNTLYSIVGHQG